MSVQHLPPHWLDKFFTEPAEGPGNVQEKLYESEEFKMGVIRAAKVAFEAYAEQKRKLDADQKLMDGSPAQIARRKFLEVLGNEVGNG